MLVSRMVGIGSLLVLFGVGHAAEVQPAATAPAAPDQAVPDQDAPHSPSDVAKRYQRARLEREIDRLQALITDLPGDLDQRQRDMTEARDDLGYESWLVDAEGDQVRTSIEKLRTRLTLLESITASQDQLDRVRMVELQNALTDISTDAAQLSIAQSRAHQELAAINRQLAAREATFERLAVVHRQLDALSPTAVVAPVPSVPAAPPEPTAPTAPAAH